MPLNFQMIVQGKVEMWKLEVEAKAYILLIQSQTLLFSAIFQAIQIHIYPPRAGALKYASSQLKILTVPAVQCPNKRM